MRLGLGWHRSPDWVSVRANGRICSTQRERINSNKAPVNYTQSSPKTTTLAAINLIQKCHHRSALPQDWAVDRAQIEPDVTQKAKRDWSTFVFLPADGTNIFRRWLRMKMSILKYVWFAALSQSGFRLLIWCRKDLLLNYFRNARCFELTVQMRCKNV